MLTFDNDAATSVVKANLGDEGVKELERFGGDFQPFPKLEEAVEKDIQLLKETKLIKDNITLSGWVYEVETGKVRQVV